MTVRTQAELLALYADQHVRAITAEDGRDLIDTMFSLGGSLPGSEQYVDVQLTDDDIKGLLSVEGVTAQGTLSLVSQPIAGQTFTIGSEPYLFVPVGTASNTGDVNVGTNLATAKDHLIAAINGTEAPNIGFANNAASAGAFVGNDLVLTAKPGGFPGTSGNSVATTSAAAGLTFDAATLGTTRLGVDVVRNDFEVIPAPGADLALAFPQFSNIWVVADFAGGAYAGADQADLRFFMGDSDTDPVVESSQIDFTNPELQRDLNDSGLQGDWADEFDGGDNKALSIANRGQTNFTGGDPANTLSLRVFYRIVPTVPFS